MLDLIRRISVHSISLLYFDAHHYILQYFATTRQRSTSGLGHLNHLSLFSSRAEGELVKLSVCVILVLYLMNPVNIVQISFFLKFPVWLGYSFFRFFPFYLQYLIFCL